MRRCVHTFSDIANCSVRFNRQGTRLLCQESNQLPIVYKVPTGHEMTDGFSRKIKFSAPDYASPQVGRNLHCFAGQYDELVVAVSTDHNLFVWSLPTVQQLPVDQVVNQPLVVLRGHKEIIHAVRYNHHMDTLVSAGEEKVIKLWTPSS